jgi:hypothetical protein
MSSGKALPGEVSIYTYTPERYSFPNALLAYRIEGVSMFESRTDLEKIEIIARTTRKLFNLEAPENSAAKYYPVFITENGETLAGAELLDEGEETAYPTFATKKEAMIFGLELIVFYENTYKIEVIKKVINKLEEEEKR